MNLNNNELIKEKIVYSNNDIKYNNALNIVYGIDNNFVRPMGVSMTSIIKNNLDENIIFHILTEYIEKIELNRLKSFAHNNNVTIIIYTIDSQIFNELPTTKYFTKATYNRFLIPKVLDSKIDK